MTNKITGVNFMITSTTLYVPIVTLSINYNIKFLENIKHGFERTISCNKYWSEVTTQPKNKNLGYMINPTFKNINRSFVPSFKNGENDPTRNYFDNYYMPFVEIKDFNELIDNKPLFWSNRKKQTKTCWIVKKWWLYTGNLLDYLYHQVYHKLIAIDLSS